MKMTLVDKIGRWLWRSHAEAGEMVGSYGEQCTFWKNEARKVLRIIERHKRWQKQDEYHRYVGKFYQVYK